MSERTLNPVVLLVPILLIGFAGILYFSFTGVAPEGANDRIVGQPAPSLKLEPLGDIGPAPSNSDLRAPGVKLVNYWASWCGPCRAEHPTLMQMAKDGIPIIGVNYRDTDENALRFLDELGSPFAGIGVDADGRTGSQWGIIGIPETFVIDGEGTVVFRYSGPITRNVYLSHIAPAIAAAAK